MDIHMMSENEESVDMDEVSKSERELQEDSNIEEDSDKEPDSEILSTDEDEVDEVEDEESDDE